MIPVTLLGGFLGSGKSTLINRLLKERPDWNMAVLVNEFGDESVESSVIEARKKELEEMSVSCLCCAPLSDLHRALRSLAKKAHPRGIIIEASGLSDPAPVARALMEPGLAKDFYLASLISVLDVGNFENRGSDQVLQDRQLALADFVLLTKTDTSTPNAVALAHDYARARAPRASVLSTAQELPWETMVDPDTHGAKLQAAMGADELHVHGAMDTWVWKESGALDMGRLRETLQRFPSNVLRVKGFFYIQGKEYRGYKYTFQQTQAHKHLGSMYWSRGEEPRNVLLFMGHDLDRGYLQTILEETRV